MKFSSTSNTSVKLVSQFPISKSAPPVLLKPWVRIKKNGKPIVLIITLVLQDYPLGYILWYFYKPLRVLSLQNFFFFFFSFSLKPHPTISLIPPWLVEIFKFMVFWWLEKCIYKSKNWIESRHFYSCSLSQKSPPGYHHPQDRGKLLFLSQVGFFRKHIFPQQNRGRQNYDWFPLAQEQLI